MDARSVAFGVIEIEGKRFEHDVVIDRGDVRKRHKGPSKASRAEYGHTPLTAAEAIPWGGTQLIIGTGHDGQLPVTPDVLRRGPPAGVRLIVAPDRRGLRAPRRHQGEGRPGHPPRHLLTAGRPARLGRPSGSGDRTPGTTDHGIGRGADRRARTEEPSHASPCHDRLEARGDR